MKLLAVLVVLLSGLGLVYALTKSDVGDVRSPGHLQSAALTRRSSANTRQRSVPALPPQPIRNRGDSSSLLPDPLLLVFFGGLMFFMAWVCVAWASWKERQGAPTWQHANGEVVAEAG